MQILFFVELRNNVVSGGFHTFISKKISNRSFLVAQQVKDLALSLMCHMFNPWSGNFCRPQVQPKKKKKVKENKQQIPNRCCSIVLAVLYIPQSLFSEMAITCGGHVIAFGPMCLKGECSGFDILSQKALCTAFFFLP